MSLKRINDKVNEKERKIRYSIQNLTMNDDSGLHCDSCKKKLGLITMIYFALCKKKGDEYIVKCRSCGFDNKRVKGALGNKIDSDWGKYGV